MVPRAHLGSIPVGRDNSIDEPQWRGCGSMARTTFPMSGRERFPFAAWLLVAFGALTWVFHFVSRGSLLGLVRTPHRGAPLHPRKLSSSKLSPTKP